MVTIKFKNIEALEAHLRADAYDRSAFEAVLQIQPSDQARAQFYELLRQEKYPCLLTPNVDSEKFKNVFARNTRYQRQRQLVQAGIMPDEIVLDSVSAAKPVDLERVSRAKVNLARGSHAEAGGLQFQKQQQVQQQRQQQVQQQQAMQTMLDKRQQQLAARSAPEQLMFIPGELSQSTIDSLITRDNIVATLSDHVKNQDEKILLRRWDELVGEHAKKIADANPERAISFVTREAMQVILANSKHFRYGLVLDNLPDGFYLQKLNNQIILGYDKRAYSNRNHPLRALRLNINTNKNEKSNETLNADQFLLDLDASKHDRMHSAYTVLNTKAAKVAEKQKALVEILSLFNDKWQKENIIALLNKLGLANDDDAIAGLRLAFNVGGAEVVMLLLSKWNQLQEAGIYDDFKAVFLRGKRDYSEFVSVEAMFGLDALREMDVSEKIWWRELTKLHRQSTGNADFNELYSAFAFSVAEIKKITKVSMLPVKHPFVASGAFNMKVALNRLMIIMMSAADKEEQLGLLQAIDLSGGAAVMASQQDDYKLVTADMLLRQTGGLAKVSDQEDEMIIFASMNIKISEKITLYDGFDILESEYHLFEKSMKDKIADVRYKNAISKEEVDEIVKKIKTDWQDNVIKLKNGEDAIYLDGQIKLSKTTHDESLDYFWMKRDNFSNKMKFNLTIAESAGKKHEIKVTAKDIKLGFKEQLDNLTLQTGLGLSAESKAKIIKKIESARYYRETNFIFEMVWAYDLMGIRKDVKVKVKDTSGAPLTLTFNTEYIRPNARQAAAVDKIDEDRFQSRFDLPGGDHAFVEEMAGEQPLAVNLKYYFRHAGQQDWALPYAYYNAVANKVARENFEAGGNKDEKDFSKILSKRLGKRFDPITWSAMNDDFFHRGIKDVNGGRFIKSQEQVLKLISKSDSKEYFLSNKNKNPHFNDLMKIMGHLYFSSGSGDLMITIKQSNFVKMNKNERAEFLEALYAPVLQEANKQDPDSIVQLSDVCSMFSMISNVINEVNAYINDDSAHNKMRHMLLHLLAQCSSTKRQLFIGDSEVHVDKIISNIQHRLKMLYENDPRDIYHAAESMLTKIYHLSSALADDLKPSTADLSNLIAIHAQNMLSPESVELFYAEYYKRIFESVSRYGVAVYDLLAMNVERQEIDAVKLLDDIDQNVNISLPTKTNLLFLLTRTDNPNENAGSDKLASVATALENLTPVVANTFIKVARKIQLDKSDALPTLDAMLAALTKAKELKDDTENLEEVMGDFLQDLWPDTYVVRKKPINNILMDILDYVKQGVDQLNIDDALKQLRESISGMMANVVEAAIKTPIAQLRTLTELLKSPEANLEKVLVELSAFEKSIANLMSGMVGTLAIQFYRKQSVGKEASEIEAYLKTKHFASLLKPVLSSNVKSVLAQITEQLKLKDEFLIEYLAKYVDEIDDTKPIGIALKEFSARADVVKVFTDVLTDIYNRNNNDFKKVYELFNKHHQTLPMEMHQELMSICLGDESMLMSDKLGIIYGILSSPDIVVTEGNLKYAFTQLKQLMLYANLVSADIFKLVLEKSFKHHVSKGALFPVIQLMELMKTGGENEKALVQHILQLISKSDASAEKEMMSAIELTAKLLQVLPQSGQLVQVLASIHQEGSSASWKSFTRDLQALDDNRQNADKLENVLTILRGILSTEPKELDVTTLLHKLLAVDAGSLILIASLFQFKPYPHHNKIPEIMQCIKEGTLAAWVEKFDLDPFGIRTSREVTAEQYSSSQLFRVVAGIRTMPDNQPLPLHEQLRLIKQSTYMNAIGNGIGIAYGNKPARPLTAWSRADLRAYSDQLVNTIRENKLSAGELEKNRLTLVAILREAYFRNTGKVPNSTQIVAVLMTLNHPGNIFLQLNTGEGKSVLSSLLVTMEWVKSAAVNFCTSTPDLASRDEDGAAIFCDFLGIDHKLITNDSAANSYAKSGVNYSTMAESSLHRASAKLFGEKIKVKQAPPTSLYVDELDAATLDSFSTAFNLAIASNENPYAWIYPLINDFVDKPEYLNIDATKGPVWDAKEDVHYLKDYLRDLVKDPDKKKQLVGLTDLQFKKWLSSATIAKQHNEGSEFVISRETRKVDDKDVLVDLAVPLDKSVPQFGSTRDNGVQQFLHARLQKDKTAKNPGKEYHFPIDSESFKSATETARNYIDRHTRKGGRLIGVSATLGSFAETGEQESQYNALAYTIPPHLPSQLEMLDAQYVHERDRNEEIVKKLKSNRKKQDKKQMIEPQLIFALDINDAKVIFKHLDTKAVRENMKVEGLIFNLITGEESASERKEKWAAAGKPNTITVTTPISTRGVDIPHDVKNKLYAVPTRPVGFRQNEQQKGRVARYGKAGVYAPIYTQSDSDIARYGIDLTKGSAKTRGKNLQRIFDLMDEDAAVERHYTQEVDTVQNIALDLFNKWYKLILRVNHQNPDVVMALSAAREALIDEMHSTWVKLLDASDPDKLYANAYVRRDENNEFQVQALDEAIEKFEDAIAMRWENELLALKEKYLATVDVKAEHPDAVTYRRYDALDIHDAIAIRQSKKAQAATEGATSIPARSLANKVLLEAATDVSAAYVEYAPALSKDEKTKYLKSAINNQLAHFGNWLPKVIRSAKMKGSDKKKLNADLKIIMASAVQDPETTDQKAMLEQAFTWINAYYAACQNNADRFLTQPFVREMLDLAEKFEFESLSITAAKKHYVDNAYGEIKQQLEQALAWRKQGKWYHKIERKVAKDAADDILHTISHDHIPVGDRELIDLYKVLMKQEMKLDKKFTFGFLHQNIKTTVRNGLASLDYLTSMRTDNDKLKKTAKAELLVEMNNPQAQTVKQARKIKQHQLHELIKEVNLPCDKFDLQRHHQGFRQHYQLIVHVDKSQADKWLALGLKEKSQNVYVRSFAKWEEVERFEATLRGEVRQSNAVKVR